MKTGRPESIANMIKFPSRIGARVSPKQWPKLNFVKTNFYFYNLLNIWNNMPLDVKSMDLRKLNKRARAVIGKCPNPLVFRMNKQ